MNYLSHQFIARWTRPDKDADALFFAGNLLPDLLAVSGDGRLRTVGNHTGAVADGICLHLATDKHFHGLPAFHAAQEEASHLLKNTDWKVPLKRRFFIAHVLTELALDAAILASQPDLLVDLYDTLSKSLNSGLLAEAEAVLEHPAPNLVASVERFMQSQFLWDYAAPHGLAESVIRVCHRAGVPNFGTVSDQERLATVFIDFAPRLQPFIPELLSPPPVPPGGLMVQ